MKGLFFTRQNELNLLVHHPQMDALQLITRCGNLEVMHQHLCKGATVWLTPALDLPEGQTDYLEFFYICSGTVHFDTDGWDTVLHAGDSFHVHNLDAEVMLTILEDTNLLYISTIPVFEDSIKFQAELSNLLRQINEKDRYTLQHSVNVRNYSMQLWNAFPERQTCSVGEMAVASLFHDVGKCTIPDHILNKPGRFTSREYAVIRQHATAGVEILRECYSGKVLDIVLQHHERLDGSGYPYGVSGDALRFESRVVGLVDSFDAMTTQRIYNQPMPFLAAAYELLSLPQLYDAELAQKLVELVETGKLVINQPVQF